MMGRLWDCFLYVLGFVLVIFPLAWAGDCMSSGDQRCPIYMAILAALDGTSLANAKFQSADLDTSAYQGPIDLNSRFKVVKLAADIRRRSIEAQIECVDRKCLPFYVHVSRVEFATNLHTRAVVVDVRRAASLPSRTLKRHQPTLHAGQKATVFVSGENMTVSFPVIAVESGVEGDVIRVRLAEGSQLCRARIVNRDSVRNGGDNK